MTDTRAGCALAVPPVGSKMVAALSDRMAEVSPVAPCSPCCSAGCVVSFTLSGSSHRRGSLGNDPLVVFVIRKSLGPPPARAPPPALSSRIQTPPPPLMQGPGPPRHPGQGDEEEETEARGDAENRDTRTQGETRGGDTGRRRETRREPASSILASILASIFSCCFVVSPPIALVVFAFSGRGGEDEVEEVALLCVTTAPHRGCLPMRPLFLRPVIGLVGHAVQGFPSALLCTLDEPCDA
ncbi:unnamed protein product [Lampetra planeri]